MLVAGLRPARSEHGVSGRRRSPEHAIITTGMRIFERVSVLCTGNICRSPMAEAVLRARLQPLYPEIEVVSAGLAALGGYPADPDALRLMDERGLDIRAHRAQQFSGRQGLDSDLILVMETQQQQAVEAHWPLLQGRVYRFGHWGNFDVDDPYQRGESAFRRALKSIDAGVEPWLKIIAG